MRSIPPMQLVLATALLAGWSVLTLSARAEVRLNEIQARSSEYTLNTGEDGTPRVGHGPAWCEGAFDDAAWTAGALPLGYGVAGLATEVDFRGEAVSLYVRRSFQVDAGAAGAPQDLVLDIDFDDGFVAYVNGREVARKSLGLAGSFVYHSQYAYHQRLSGDVLSIHLGPAADLLREGENILAIQVHGIDLTLFETTLATDTFYIDAGLHVEEQPDLFDRAGAWRYFVGREAPSGGILDDWLELYNDGDAAVDLGGWSLSDDPGRTKQWVFPETRLDPGAYLVVLATGEGTSGTGLETNFRLSGEGDFLGFFNPAGEVVDRLAPAYPEQFIHASYGRDATGAWRYGYPPTPGAANSATAYAGALAAPLLDPPPGVKEDSVAVVISHPDAAATLRYTLDGTVPTETTGTVYTEPLTVTDNAVVRARAFREGWVPSHTVTGSYLYRLSEGGSVDLNVFIGYPDGTTGQVVGPPPSHSPYELLAGQSMGQTFRATVPFTRIGSHNPTWHTTDGAFTVTLYAGRGGAVIASRDIVDAVDNAVNWLDFAEQPPGDYYIAIHDLTSGRAGWWGATYDLYPDGQAWFGSGGDAASALAAIPLLSIVGDPAESLYEPRGIMAVVGSSPDALDNYNNVLMHGRAFERPVSVEFLPQDGAAGRQVDCGIRVAGSDVHRPGFQRSDGLWRSGGQKWSFRLYFRSDYGEDTFDYAMLPEAWSVNRYDVMALRSNTADWVNPAIYDELARRLQVHTGVPEAAYGMFANLFVNGSYKGYYNLCERLDGDHFQLTWGTDNPVDVVKAQVDKFFQPQLELHGGDYNAWNDLIAFARGNDLSIPVNYAEIAAMLDIPEFIDWIIVNVYAGNVDWPWNNWVAAREQAPGAKWRFYVWDADYAWGRWGGNAPDTVFHATLGHMENQNNEVNYLYRALKASPEFKLVFLDRIQALLTGDGPLAEHNVEARVVEMRAQLEPVIAHVFGQDFEPWLQESWIPQRGDYLLAEMFPAYGYAPALLPPTYAETDGDVTLTNPNDPAGAVYYTTNGEDPRRAAMPDGLTLLRDDAPRRATVPEEDLGDAWRTDLAYDDSAWLGGAGGVGYDLGADYEPYFVIDLESQMYGQHATCYIRIPFTVTAEDRDAVQSLALYVQYDDGFVAYLNGTEVARRNFTGLPTWDALATGGQPDANAMAFQEVDITSHAGLLREGENLLAFHGLNSPLTSSDFLSNVRMVANASGVATPSPNAEVYGGPFPKAPQVPLHARVFDASSGAWSPLLSVASDPASQAYGNLRITEFMYHPAEGGAEFIELWNQGDTPLDATGVQFTNGITFVFPEGSVLLPGQRLVLTDDEAAFTAAYPGTPVYGVYTGSLSNGGETVELSDPEGNVIWRFTYDDEAPWPAVADGLGFSLVNLEPAADPDLPEHWRASTLTGGDPGVDDTPPDDVPAVRVNEALTHTDLPDIDAVELHNPTDAIADVRGWFLTDDRMAPRGARIPDDPRFLLPPGGYVVITADDFSDNPGSHAGDPLPGFLLSSKGGEEVYLFSADAGGDLTGYSHGFALTATPTGVALGRHAGGDGRVHFVMQRWNTLGAENSGPRVGPIVVSELHYHPLTGEVEYLELSNISGRDVNLWNDAPGADPADTFKINGIAFAFPEGVTMEPGSRALVVNGDPVVFRATHGVPAEVAVFGPFGNDAVDAEGSLDNGGERITLEAPLPPDPPVAPETVGEVAWMPMDSVQYDDDAPWADADGNGLALQRVDAGAFGDDAVNWAAGEPRYGAGEAPVVYHSADVNLDHRIGLDELLRVIQLYRAGALHCDATDDDGYAPGAGDTGCLPHAGDWRTPAWSLDLGEVLRVVQLHQAGAYRPRVPDDPPTEDGFVPGG